ncbi:MAG: hypothetical protein IPN04_12585 [Rhodoferax sp.]|nr:hypothetical protein [Rhodoferax sp.]
MGLNARATADNAIAIGADATASIANNVALGRLSVDKAGMAVTTTTMGAIVGNNAGVGSAANGVVSVGDAGRERQVVNVAAGAVTSTSTDAINGSQLFVVGTAIASTDTRVGAAEARIAVTESRLNSTDTRLAVSDQRTTTLENKVAVMGDQISDVRQESRRRIAAAALVMSIQR